MSDSGIEIRANHLGLHQNRDEYGNGYQQQNYNIHQAANNMNYENIPSYHWPNSQAVTSPPSDIYSASRERDAGLCAEGRGASKAFRLASESRESYIWELSCVHLSVDLVTGLGRSTFGRLGESPGRF